MRPDEISHMFSGVRKSWRDSIERLQTTRLVIVPSLVGALTGAAAIGFVELLNLVQWCIIGSTDLPLRVVPHLAWYHVALAPALGGLIVGPLVRYLAPEAEGHGVPEVIEAVMLRGGRIRRRVAAVKSIASAVTIGSGGSVGREGPIVQIGAALGSAVGQVLRLPPEQLKTLAACGAAAGIAAVFNAPIAGAFFALEVIIGNFAVPSFGPVILASVLATVTSRAYFGDHPAFIVQPYRLQSLFEILTYAGLGIVSGIVGAAFTWTMDRTERLAPRLPIPKVFLPALGGLLLGLLILPVPNLYGVGYATMDAALKGDIRWTWLAVLLPAKMIATSVTLASGGSGGVFLPSLYLGAVAGGLYGTIVHGLLPHLTSGSGAYALVGMAGVLSAATHSPITAMILLFEVTGDYEIILPVMIVVTLASLAGRALKKDSLYTLQLSRRGIALHRREDIIMRTHSVSEVMQPAAHVVRDDLSIAEIVQYFLSHEAVTAYVVDANQRLLGSISIHDIKNPEVEQLGPLVHARDVVETNTHRVAPTDTLADCMNEFALSNGDQLAVVDREHLVGVVSRRDVLSLYSSELLRHEFLSVDHPETRARAPIQIRQGLMVTRLQTPASLVGLSLRQANLRASHHLTVVAVKRPADKEDQMPDPDQPLCLGDVLVVVGEPADIRSFVGTNGGRLLSAS